MWLTDTALTVTKIRVHVFRTECALSYDFEQNLHELTIFSNVISQKSDRCDQQYVMWGKTGRMDRRRLAVVTGFARTFAKFENLLTLYVGALRNVVGNLWIPPHYIWSSIFKICGVHIWFCRQDTKAVTSYMRLTCWELLVVNKLWSPTSVSFRGLEAREVNRREWLVLSCSKELFCTAACSGQSHHFLWTDRLWDNILLHCQWGQNGMLVLH